MANTSVTDIDQDELNQARKALGTSEVDPKELELARKKLANPEMNDPGFVTSIKSGVGQQASALARSAKDIPVIGGIGAFDRLGKWGDRVQENNPMGIQSLSDVIDSPVETLKEGAGNAIAQMPANVASGAAGRVLGGILGARFGNAALGQKIGAWAGMGLPTLAQEYGGIRQTQDQEVANGNPEADDKGRALAGALPAAAVEFGMGPQRLLGRMIGEGFEGSAKQLAAKFAKETAGMTPAQASRHVIKSAGKDILRNGAEEGAEELVQNPLEAWGAHQDPMSSETIDQSLTGAALGFSGGLALGSPMTAMQHAKAKSMADNGLVAETPAAPPSPRGPLSAAAAAGQAAMPTAAPVAPADPLAERVAAMAPTIESKDLIRQMRSDPRFGPETITDALHAWAIGRNPALHPSVRAQALDNLEQLFGPRNFNMGQTAPSADEGVLPGEAQRIPNDPGTGQLAAPPTYPALPASVDTPVDTSAAPVPAPLIDSMPSETSNPSLPATPSIPSVETSPSIPSSTVVPDDDMEAKTLEAFNNVFGEDPSATTSETKPAEAAPSVPAAPDPIAIAEAQTQARVDAARADEQRTAARNLIRDRVAHGYTEIKDGALLNPKTGATHPLNNPAEFLVAHNALRNRIDEAAHTAATSHQNDLTQPSDAQKEAGNYAKGHVEWNGLNLAIENPKGSERSGTDPNGKAWSVTMPGHYGYVKKTLGADGDQVDLYLGNAPHSKKVFVVDQIDADTGKFDEHKAIGNVRDEAEATKLYDAGFSDGKGPQRRGAITEMSVDQFKDWVKKGDTTKALAYKVPNMAPSPKESARSKPRLGESPQEVWAAIKAANGGIIVNGRTARPAIRVPGLTGTFSLANDFTLDKLVAGGKGLIKATREENKAVDAAVDQDRAEVVAMSQWGQHAGDKNGNQKVIQVLHSPSGNSYQTQPNPTQPEENNATIPEAAQAIEAEAQGSEQQPAVENDESRFVAAAAELGLSPFNNNPNIQARYFGPYNRSGELIEKETVVSLNRNPDERVFPYRLMHVNMVSKPQISLVDKRFKTLSDAVEATREALVVAEKNAPTENKDAEVSAEFNQEATESAPGEINTDIAENAQNPVANEDDAQNTASELPFGIEIKSFQHTKTGETKFAVVVPVRTSSEDYQTLNKTAIKHRGRYSSFKGSGAVPGFLFGSNENAVAWANDPAVAGVLKGYEKADETKSEAATPKKPEESNQERSFRKWGENYNTVVNTADLSSVSLADLERADSWADSFIASERRKGWDGGAVNETIINAMAPDVAAIKAELSKRYAERDARLESAKTGAVLAKAGSILLDEYGENEWSLDADLIDDVAARNYVTIRQGMMGERKQAVTPYEIKKRIAEDAKFRAEHPNKSKAEENTPSASDAVPTEATPASIPYQYLLTGELWDAMSYSQHEAIANGYIGGMRAVVHRLSGSKWADIGPGERKSLQESYDKLEQQRESSRKADESQEVARAAAEAEVFEAMRQVPAVINAATNSPHNLDVEIERQVAQWLGDQIHAAAIAGDGDRARALSSLLADNKPVLPPSFFEGLKESLKQAEAIDKEDALAEKGHDPANLAYVKAELQADQKDAFLQGWAHALAGKTKSTLPGNAAAAKGYDTAREWLTTPEGRAAFSGKRAKKLENTGADLRRWFDKQKAKIRDDSDNEAVIAALDLATGRADLMRGMVADLATPGTLRWMEQMRYGVMPFKQWITERGMLQRLYGRVGNTDTARMSLYLEGKAYLKDDLENPDAPRSFFDEIKLASTREQRIAKLRDAAQEYATLMSLLTDGVRAAGTVEEAARALQSVLWGDESQEMTFNVYDQKNYSDTGKLVATLLSHPDRTAWRFAWNGKNLRDQTYSLRGLIDKENDALTTTKKAALVPPRLDHVERTGEDYRGGSNVSPEQFKRKFNFADVGFGKWVNSRQDQDHLNYAYDAFLDLAKLLNVPPESIALGGKLHFTIGALGQGKFAAHYAPSQPHPDGGTVPVINVTNTRGDGTVAHEWAHAMDLTPQERLSVEGDYAHLARAISIIKADLKYAYHFDAVKAGVMRMLGGDAWWKGDKRSAQTDAGRLENARRAIDYYSGASHQLSTYYKEAIKLDGNKTKDPYWSNDLELFARAFEGWTGDALNGTSTYLVNPEWSGEGMVTDKTHRGTPYPLGEERERFAQWFDALAKSMVYDAEIKALRLDALKWAENRPKHGDEWKTALDDLRASLPAILKQVKQEQAEKEATESAARDEARTMAVGDVIRARRMNNGLSSRFPDPLTITAVTPTPDGLGVPRISFMVDDPAGVKPTEHTYTGEFFEVMERATDRALKEAAAAKTEAESSAPAIEPTGTLSDTDYERLFDEAAAELSEAAAEQPESPVTAALPGGWTVEDVKEIQALVNAGKIVLVADEKLGIPTIHDFSGRSAHLGFGTFRLSTPEFEVLFDGGAAMHNTPSGKGYTVVLVNSGTFPYDEAGVKATLQGLLSGTGTAETAIAAEDKGSMPEPDGQPDKKDEQPKPAKKPRPGKLPKLDDQVQKTASALIADAAKMGVKGVDEALTGLVKLFGGGAGKLMSFPAGMDEDTYKSAKPHFEAALKSFQEAGMSLKDLFKWLIEKFGLGIKPYALHFAKESALSTDLGEKPSARLAVSGFVQKQMAKSEAFTSRQLFDEADRAFGGTQAEGKYSPKDAYDAMESGVNQYLLATPFPIAVEADKAADIASLLQDKIRILPTQTRRDAEMDEFQQFSTPPALSYVANWVAAIKPGEIMAEPSAGTGDLAVWAKKAGADLILNELSSRRVSGLKELFPGARVFSENAEQLHNVLPIDAVPTVVVMNPPFSATAGRAAGTRDTMNGARHIEQALKRLTPNGRLVAIVGQGMAADRPAFKEWWKSISATYNVRANIGIDGSEYAKYGTTFDNQILVIDKDGPTQGVVLTGKVARVAELPALLEKIRDTRPQPTRPNRPGESDADQPGGSDLSDQDGLGYQPGGDLRPDTDALGSGKRPKGKGNKRGGRLDQQSGGTPGAAGDDATGDRGAGGGGQSNGNGPDDGNGSAGSSGDATGKSGAELQSGVVGLEAIDAKKNTDEISDSVFENYYPQRLSVPGAKPHPGRLVQSAAMGAVEPPAPTYVPNLPKKVIDKGLLSIAQIESVVYAGQAHNQMLPNGERRGFFIGDGTGVGKGREISGIILDNLRQGRDKAVWVSFNEGLFTDAKRDMTGIGADPEQLFWLGKTKADAAITAKRGVLFTTYSTLGRGGSKKQATADATTGKSKPAKTRGDQIVEWLGEDFDGVIVFDEAHSMGNAIEMRGRRGKKKPSAQAIAGIDLQKRLPKARIVYVSATGATELSNLSYASRLGLWGEGTPFATPIKFINDVSAGGVAAMELIARDMKALGMYIARSLSYDGVTYERLDHELTPLQTDIYNELAKTWQTVLLNVNEALGITGQDMSGDAKSAALSAFWSTHQRFFNQVITSMQTPTVIESMRQQIAAGHAVVIQLTNTNEAEQERQVARAQATDTALEELDFTPRQALMDYVRNGFPVAAYETYVDDNGNTRSRPVVDSEGNLVQDQDAVAMRDQLLGTLEQIRVPENPIDAIINAFGSDKVGEVTGRKRRFVQTRDEDGNLKIVEEKRGSHAAKNDADSFQDDKKPILIFSQAGGTGYSFHASNEVKNQRRRIHYILQPGWRADVAIQGTGRTHRTNQANEPHYALPTTNLKAQKRFVSTIARRMDQMGALTRGQRQAAGQGLFSAADNLESQYAIDALDMFFNDLYSGKTPLNFNDITQAMGLTGLINEDTGGLNTSRLPEIPQFLNRLLSLQTHEQDAVFDEFSKRLDEIVAYAVQNGTFDNGLQTLRAESIVKKRDEVAYVDPRTGAETRYIEVDVTNPIRYTKWKDASAIKGFPDFKGWFKDQHGRLFGFRDLGDRVDAAGKTVRRGAKYDTRGRTIYVDNAADVLQGYRYIHKDGLSVKETIAIPMNIADMPAAWAAEIEVAPKKSTQLNRLVVGVILPVWDRVRGRSTIVRLQTDDGERMIGRLLTTKDAEATLKNLGLGSSVSKLSTAEVLSRILAGEKAILGNGWEISRVKVSGEDRLELKSSSGYFANGDQSILKSQGVFFERIQWNERAFIPMGEQAESVFKRVTESRQVVDLIGSSKKAQDDASETVFSMGSGEVRISTADKAVYGMANEGRSAAEILGFIQASSRNPFYRQLAKLLLKTGINPSVTVGDSKGWKFNAGRDNKYSAAYNPKTDAISLFRPASAERHALHEMVHAATIKALQKQGLSSLKMRALFAHVKKSGKLKGMYGMTDIDEFMAEAFTNPFFQEKLRSVSAPSGMNGLKNAWHWFVRVVSKILGLEQGDETALSAVLSIGVGVMRENKQANNSESTRSGYTESMAKDNLDPDDKEAAFVQSNVEGKSLLEVAQWIESAGAPSERLIASKVIDRLQMLQRAGVALNFKVAHVGDKIPVSLANARGMASYNFGKNDSRIDVWVNGSDVTGKVGMSPYIVLHELVHAATMGAVRLGNYKVAAGTKLAADVADLYAVSNAVNTHINQRIKAAKQGKTKLTPFEQAMFDGDINAFSTPNETLAWALTDAKAQSYLESIPYKGKSAWTAFVQAIRNLLGLSPSSDTALSEVLRVAEALMSDNINEMIPIANATGTAMTVQSSSVQEVATNDDIRYSTSADPSAINGTPDIERWRDILKSPDVLKSLRQQIADQFQSQKTFNWWHRTIGSQYHKAKVDADFAKVYERAQQYLDDTSRLANEAADIAPGLLPKTNNMADAARGIYHMFGDKKDAQAIAGPVFHGTMLEKTFTDDELRNPPEDIFGKPQFAPLTDKQIKLYRQYRATIDKSLDDLAISEMARLSRTSKMLQAPQGLSLRATVAFYREQYEAALENAQTALADVKQQHADDMAMLESAAQDQASNADERKKYAGLREAMKTRQAAELSAAQRTVDNLEELDKGIVGRAGIIEKLKGEGYSPLMRFGQYTVDVFYEDENGKPMKDTDGNEMRPFFGMYESEAMANKVARALTAEYPDATVKKGIMSQRDFSLFKGVTPETLEIFGKLMGAEQDEAFQSYLKLAVNNRSAMKRLVHRMGVAGFNDDPTRVLASFITSNARAAAGNYHLGEMLRETSAIPKGKGDVKDEAVKLLQYLQNPSSEGAWLRSLLFANFLGGSVASALVNLTQTFITTVPFLHQFGGNTTGNVLSAMKLAAGRMGTKKKTTGDAVLDQSLKRAEEEGVVSPHEIHMLQGESMRSGVLTGNRFTRNLMKGWGSFFSVAEQYNREVAFIAAYKVAQTKGMSGEQAYQFAVDAVNQTQFQYSKASRSNWGRGPVGASLMIFKTFTLSYLEFVKRLPPKERALAMAVLFVAAGAQGLPFADDLDDLLDTIMQSLGFAWNTKQEKRAAIAKVLGADAAGFIQYGVSYGLPIDLSGRLGLGNLIPGSAAFKPSETNKTRDVAEFFGAAGGLLQQAMKGFEKVQSGDVLGAAKALAPKAAADAIKGLDMANKGYYTDTTGRRVADVSGLDALVKGIGFQPEVIAEDARARSIVQDQITLDRSVQGHIQSMWSQGLIENDPEKVSNAQAALRDWNEKNPESKIVISRAAILRLVQQARLTSDQRMVNTMPKQMKAQLRQTLEGNY